MKNDAPGLLDAPFSQWQSFYTERCSMKKVFFALRFDTHRISRDTLKKCLKNAKFVPNLCQICATKMPPKCHQNATPTAQDNLSLCTQAPFASLQTSFALCSAPPLSRLACCARNTSIAIYPSTPHCLSRSARYRP